MGEICIGARLAESVFSLKNEADAGSTQEAYSPSSSSSIQSCRAQNSHDMSVTPDVSQVEMWPYVDSAAVLSASHAWTAVSMLLSSKVPSKAVGGGVVGWRVGRGVGDVLGVDVGSGVGAQVPAAF